MSFELITLPYAFGALEPYMSKETLSYHRDKHHQGYISKLNDAISGTEFEAMSLVEIIRKTSGDKEKEKIFNNAAQSWNHTFFFCGLSHSEHGEPKGEFASALEKGFDGIDGFKESFKEAATGRFGSGYAWLVFDDGKLEICDTINGVPPFIDGKFPLLALDVWEHAYYLDYRNRRDSYVEAFLNYLVNWEFVATQWTSAKRGDPIFSGEERSLMSASASSPSSDL